MSSPLWAYTFAPFPSLVYGRIPTKEGAKAMGFGTRPSFKSQVPYFPPRCLEQTVLVIYSISKQCLYNLPPTHCAFGSKGMACDPSLEGCCWAMSHFVHKCRDPEVSKNSHLHSHLPNLGWANPGLWQTLHSSCLGSAGVCLRSSHTRLALSPPPSPCFFLRSCLNTTLTQESSSLALLLGNLD